MSDLPRIWKVTVTYEVYVLSHRAEEAADCGKLDPKCYADIEHTGTATAEPVTKVTPDDGGTLPWIAPDVKASEHLDDITIQQWLERIKEESK